MEISVTPELESFVSAAVQSGRFRSASEVIEEALRLLEEHEKERIAARGQFNDELDHRIASLERGEHVDPVAARQSLRGRSQERRGGG